MRKTNRFIALLLTLVMLVGAMPLGVFAADSALSYESEIYTDATLAGYKQYETMWTDSDYVKGDAKITVYFDKENATEIRDAIIYVINWNDTGIGRIGKDSDVDIVTDYVKAGPSVETKHRAAVIVVDYGNNPLAVATVIEKSLAVIRHNFVGNPKSGNGKLTVWADPAAETKTTTTVTTSASNVYVLPAGYRVMRDIPYFETDVHAALGTFKSIINAWNSHIAYNPALVEDVYLAKKRAPRAIRYAYHTGDTATCTYDHATYTEVECYKGAPQEIDGVIVPYENVITHTGDKTTCPYPHSEMLVTDCTKNEKVNIHWAPVVDRIEDCRKPDGSPLNFVNRLDIIYPSGSPDVKTPVFVQAATHSPRMHNIGVIGDVTTNHKKLRTSLVGFTFSGYVGAVYDYVYIPMARDDHFNYIDPYLTHNSNGAKTSRAAIRCIRYYAEELGFDAELIGVAGISKGTPSVGVLSTINNKYVVEQGSPKYVIDGVEVSTNTAGYFEGDLNDDGTLTKGRTVQPYLSYDQGYDGTVTYDDEGNVVNEISSEISVAYCAAGDGINWIYNGNSTIKLGATNSVTGEETQHVPMVLSCGYHDEYGCWDHWDDIQARFTEYADNPFIAISMEDMGHDYPAAIDPIRDYDRYLAYVQFFHSVLKPELYTSQVAWMTPVNGAKDVPVGSQIQVQLIKPAASLEDIASKIKGEYFTIAFKSADSNTYGYRNDFEGYKVGQTFSDGNKDLPNSTLDNNVYDATETSILHYYGFTDSNRDVKYTLARRGGNLDRSVIADPENADNKVLKANTSSGVTNAGRLKIYNALLDRVITTDDVGRTFRFTVKVKAGKASTADPSTLKISISPMLSYGWTVISRSTAPIATTATATSEQLQAGWVTISCDYTVSEKDIKSSQNNGTVYAYPMFNIEFYNGPAGVYNQYLVDDISVVELDENGNEMAITLPSSEAGENSVIIRGRTDSDPVADTYVSAVDIAVNTAEGQKAPGTDKDNIYGNGDFLFVSGKTSAVGERVALISYSNKAITEGDILSLNLPVVNDTSAKVNLYILSDYLLDESKMNYTLYESEVKSKMTLVAENVSLSEGTQKISLGDAQLASGDYFTVIITAAEDAEHVYFNDFERWEAGTHGNTNNKNSLYTSYLHEVDSTAYKNSVGDFIGYSDKYFYVRGSDPTTSYMSVVTDPDGSDNNALMHQVGSKGPRIKFVNSLSFDALTAEDVGDTYRATFRMKAVASNGKAYTQNSKMGALRVSGSSFEENTATVNNKQTVSVVTGEDWKEFTYDYVIDANDIKADANGINYNDPLFAIEFASNSTATVYYYIDDLQVIKLEDGKEPVVKVASLENTDLEAVVPSAVTFDSTTPVADTYVSNYYVDKAFGTENVLKFGDSPDGEKFAMALTFSAEAIKNGRYMALKLPEMTAEVKDVHVYYLSDYAVDESATTWNNLPDYKGNLVGVYDLAAGENRLDVTAIADKLEGEYFTLIFRTEHFVYKNGFDNIAKNKSLAKHDNNVKDAEITSRLHYYPYTDKAYTYTATRRGGALGTRKVIALEGAPSGTQVLSVPSSSSDNTYGGYLKFYNALMTDADSDIAGKTFRYSVKVKLAGSKNTDSTSRACLAEAGVITSFGNVFLNKQTASAAELQAGWVTLTGTYTIDKANIDEYRKSNTSSAYNYSFPMFGVYFEDPGTAAGTYTYYVDDMSMVELVDGEPVNTLTTIASREADGGAVFVSGLDNAISIIETSVSSASEGAVITVVDNGSTHTLLEAANGKLSYNGITLLDSKGEAIVIGDEAVAAVAIYDDVNRTVRFAVGNAIAYYADGEEIKATFELPAIESGVSDKAVLGSKAITAKKLTRPEPKIVGDQINDITNSVRFVSGVDCLYFNSVGFRIVNSGSAEDKGNASYRVFTEIHADDKLVSAKILGYNYLAAIEIEDVNSSSVIKVTPYVTVGENVIEGKAIYYAITFDSKVAVNVTDSTQFVTPEAE